MCSLCPCRGKLEPARRILLSCVFAISTSPILHLVCPPKFCISIVFSFSWDDCNAQGKWKTMVIQIFGGQKRCIMGNVEMANVCNADALARENQL